MHGLVLLDAADRVLRPAILWNDQRTAAECDLIRATIGPDRLIAITGNDAVTGLTAPKLVWVRDHEPEVWQQVAHILLPKDYVRLQLTGDHAMDKADGAGTLLFDLVARDWSPVMLDLLGIDPAVAAADARGAGGHRPDQRRGRRRDGAACRHAGRGRRRRPGRQCGRGRCRVAGHDGAVARHVRGRLRRHGRAAVRPARSGPCLLPRACPAGGT